MVKSLAGRSSPLRIGYVVSGYPRLSESFILNEILGLEERGAELSLFALTPGDDPRFNEELARVKAAVRYLPSLGSSREVVKAFKLARAPWISDSSAELVFEFIQTLPEEFMSRILIQSLHLAAWVRELGIQHVHAHFIRNTAACAYLQSLITGVPFTVTVHAFDIYKQPVEEAAIRRIASAARALVTVCESNRRYLIDHLLEGDSTPVVRIYNGLPLGEIHANPAPPESRLVLGVGRLVEKKGWPVLLEACSIMKKDGVDFKCILAGEGEERERLLNLQSELGLEETLDLRGGLRRKEVLSLMSQARVFAAPCVTALDGDKDALPTVILEAMAVGTPVVSTPVNGIPEIIENGSDGLLVPEQDPAELAAAITRLLDDDTLAKRLADAGRRTVETRFNRDRTLPQLEEVFRQSIQGSFPGEIQD